ncbi:hypothetical protein ILUMI_06580 [Ignelater luminosus]|uniref:NADH dehydrogenase [ubiquinone] 1 beta subcomplex subunit 11, mitochondrial n=1 Tax=Ignelater luminosus TaxID=2038154 RepID=A0A8K0GHL8_IGNLU|nr:hypothetical protein ILUMI_06580 [Ignelater luminosus]
MAALRLRSSLFQKTRSFINMRQIATSKKKEDTAAMRDVAKQCKTEQVPAEPKNWVSYGFDRYNEKMDRNVLHLTFFSTITLGLVCGGFVFMYGPDINLKDWAQREAFVELRRREEKGLLPIDPNLIDPSQITLPSDEELGDTEIII